MSKKEEKEPENRASDSLKKEKAISIVGGDIVLRKDVKSFTLGIASGIMLAMVSLFLYSAIVTGELMVWVFTIIYAVGLFLMIRFAIK